jgi:hypothetical protein
VTSHATEFDNVGRMERRRLFVPLATVSYEWWLSGKKRWEIRRARGAFAVDKLAIGRRVELRRGYQDAESALWGTVTGVESAESLEALLWRVPALEVIPDAVDTQGAIARASEILAVSPRERTLFVAFRIDVDDSDVRPTRIKFSPKYLQLVMDGRKTATVRRGQQTIPPGPAILGFGSKGELAAAVTAVTWTSTQSLDDADALRDGFANRKELLAALVGHYPDLRLNEPVTIVEFKWNT